jgi:hypothetical protein
VSKDASFFPHYYPHNVYSIKIKFGSKETPLKGRLKIRHYLKYTTLLLDTHLEEKALLVPKKVPKAISRQWDYLSTSQVNFNPKTRKCCFVRGVYACVRIRGTTMTLAMRKKSLCFKWVPCEASVEVWIWKRSVVLRSPDVNR